MSGPLPAQGASWLGVVLVVVQPEQQLSQVRVDLVVSDTWQDLEEQEGLTTETLKLQMKYFIVCIGHLAPKTTSNYYNIVI